LLLLLLLLLLLMFIFRRERWEPKMAEHLPFIQRKNRYASPTGRENDLRLLAVPPDICISFHRLFCPSNRGAFVDSSRFDINFVQSFVTSDTRCVFRSIRTPRNRRR